MHKVTTSPSFSLTACFTPSILAYNTWETVTVIFLSPRLFFSTLFMRVFLRRTLDWHMMDRVNGTRKSMPASGSSLGTGRPPNARESTQDITVLTVKSRPVHPRPESQEMRAISVPGLDQLRIVGVERK